jgi:hypothetical protein
MSALLGWVLTLALAQTPATPAKPAPPSAPKPQPAIEPSEAGWEVLRYECRSDLGRRDVTLFRNGTIRLRRGPLGRERMTLIEIPRDDVGAYARRLAGEQLGEVDARPGLGAEGDWVERCFVAVRLPDEEETRRYDFGRMDTLPLPLSALVQIAEEIAAKAELREGEERLPPDYVPTPGDILRRADGNAYEVMGDTADGRGVELWGVEQPLIVYLTPDEVRRDFVAVARPGAGRD